MSTEPFISSYLQPSVDCLDRSFTLPLPTIRGLEKSADFIVQGRQEKTHSTNIMTTWQSGEENVRVVEVYKNTQNLSSGIFIRLVGTISLVRLGYPLLFLDAAIANVDPRTGEQQDIGTRVAVHLPQADTQQREDFFEALNHTAQGIGLKGATASVEQLPDFWGPFWHTAKPGTHFDAIKLLRDGAWNAYQNMCEQTPADESFDYRPTQEMVVFSHSSTEHKLFKRLGLSVPEESQAAFFSVLVTSL